jgi:CRISPR/Cas system-associated exonuclease Cas4 (RecB family)
LPIEYSKEKVKKLLKVVKEIFKFLEKHDWANRYCNL